MDINDNTYDVAVIGAGTAGLQAALTLGRMRRRVLVLGTDRYRNDPATHMQNFIGHDGTPPAELRVAARKDVEQYPTVDFADHAVRTVGGAPDGFTIELVDAPAVTARRVVLATGVRDHLPDVPGLDGLFGDVVAHCPFCHGYELRDVPIGILAEGPKAAMLAAMVHGLASGITVLTGGAPVDPEHAAALARLGADVRTEPLTGTCRSSLGLRVELDGGTPLELGGLFVATAWEQAAPFVVELGVELSPAGGVLVDAMGRTTRDGIYAAGDLAHTRDLPQPMASVLTAAAAGLVAGASCHRDLAMSDAGLPMV